MEQQVKILCVDDEPNILAAFRRQLRDRYELEVLSSPTAALEQIGKGIKYGVLISDMRMPDMDGAAFLRRVREISPETVRVMLTGNSDQETAAQAVNQGKIFRFLTKPCSSDELASVLDEAMEYHRLITAERDLLQNTLSGSIKVLTDILSLVDPIAFGAGACLRQPVRDICGKLGIQNTWEIELAAMLSVVGWVSVPEQVKQKHRSGAKLTTEEATLIAAVQNTSSSLIQPIPRLQGVAKIISLSAQKGDSKSAVEGPGLSGKIIIGAKVLRITQAIVELETAGVSYAKALEKLKQNPNLYSPELVEKLLAHENQGNQKVIPETFSITPRDLCVGHRLTTDLYCTDGRLLLTAGTYISELLRQSILNYAVSPGLRLPLMVDSRIPLSQTKNKGSL